MSRILTKLLRHFGLVLEYEVVKPGFFPVGQGTSILKMSRAPGSALKLSSLKAVAPECINEFELLFIGKTPETLKKVSKQIEHEFKKIFKRVNGESAWRESETLKSQTLVNKRGKHEMEMVHLVGHGKNSYYARSLCFDKTKSVEKEIDAFLEKVEEELAAGLVTDEFTQDQIVIFGLLAEGATEFLTGEISEHTKAAFYVVETLLGKEKVKVEEVSQGNNLVRINGIGFDKRLKLI